MYNVRKKFANKMQIFSTLTAKRINIRKLILLEHEVSHDCNKLIIH